MAKIITDEDVRYYLKNPAVTEYMVLRDKLQDLENAREKINLLKTELGNYIDKYFLESQKVVNLRKFLREIKEIAEICCKTTDCKKCKFFEICENNCVDVILQKISECEGNDD